MRISFRASAARFAAFVQRCEQTLSLSASPSLQAGMVEASDIYHESMRLRFATASVGDGTWVPLALATVKEHARLGDYLPHKLVITGDLEQSLYRGSDDHVLRIEGNAVIEGTQDYKAAWQHDGTERIPARPILVEPASDVLEAMAGPISDGLDDALSAARWG